MSSSENWKATELWLTAIVGVVNTILGSTAGDSVTSCLMICLTITAVSYIICRTVFKIFKLRYRPDEVVNFSAISEEGS
jgi:hypothetical protein